jgi:hypothetical protein
MYEAARVAATTWSGERLSPLGLKCPIPDTSLQGHLPTFFLPVFCLHLPICLMCGAPPAAILEPGSNTRHQE